MKILSLLRRFFSFSLSIFFIATVAISMLFVSGCNDTDTPVEQKSALRVLYSDWPPDMITYLAKEKGFFEKYNMDVELIKDEGLSNAKEIRQSTNIDIWAYPLLDFLTEHAEKTDTSGRVFLLQDFSAGADGVITLPKYNIKSVADLKGKKVGVEKGTVGEFFLQILLEREGLTLQDIAAVDMPYDGVYQGLQDGEIVAGVTYEPELTASVASGAKILVDTQQERNVIVDVFVAKYESLEKNPELYQGFIQGILDASKFLNTNPDEAAEIMKEPLAMTKEEVIDIFSKLKIPDLRENQTAFNRLSGFASLYSLGKQAEKYLTDQQTITEKFDLEPLFYSKLIESIKE